MQNKKLMITLASVCIAFVAVVTALVIVLVSGGQSAKSNVTVKFVATDVACEIEGKYEKVDLTAENRTDYWGFTGSMGKQLVINETTTNGKLNPSGDIELDTNYSRVVFQYAFTNTMLSSPMYIELTGMPDNDTDGESFDNIDMLYYNTYVRQDALFSGVYDEELRDSMGKLVVPAQCTKYVYLVVSVDALTEDANFIGEIEWTLTRGEKPNIRYQEPENMVIISDAYIGCEITEADLNHSTVNIRADGNWSINFMDPAVFPLVSESGKILYCSYKKGNIAEENLSFSSTSRTISVKEDALVTGATSTVAGYTPITATDTTLVIPDMFKLSDGRILPIIRVWGCYSGGNSCILMDNTVVTTMYYGNNVNYVNGTPATGSSVLRDIWFGRDLQNIGHGFASANTALTNVYMNGSSTNSWSLYNVGSWWDYVSEETVSSSTAWANYLKSNCGMGMDLARFGGYAGYL